MGEGNREEWGGGGGKGRGQREEKGENGIEERGQGTGRRENGLKEKGSWCNSRQGKKRRKEARWEFGSVGREKDEVDRERGQRYGIGTEGGKEKNRREDR
jgi:hypothetical protein